MTVVTPVAAPWHHVVVEGPIGVGKTTLAARLAAHWGAVLVREQPQANPFLERFYRDGAACAFQTQLFFLFQRVEQLRPLAQPELGAPPVVADYMFEKDALFARLTLDDEEYRLYAQIYAQLAPQVPQPDLIVWLRAPVEVLLERIRRRGIPMEQAIGADYLARLADAYAEHFARRRAPTVLALDTEGFHPAADARDFDRLLARLAAVAQGASP